jgi:hypothetical protein
MIAKVRVRVRIRVLICNFLGSSFFLVSSQSFFAFFSFQFLNNILLKTLTLTLNHNLNNHNEDETEEGVIDSRRDSKNLKDGEHIR